MPSDDPSQPKDLRSDYLAGGLSEFFSVPPGDTRAALAAPRSADREALSSALGRSAARFRAPEAVLGNIERLARPGSRAVVTGQQAGLLLGPMYTLSKAMTAVKLAARLDTEETPVVPVFWVASQDHDVAEVDHAFLLDASETLRRAEVRLPDGVPVGRIPLEERMLSGVLASIGRHSPRPAFADEVTTALREDAAVGRTFVGWFIAQLYRFLGRHGVVVLDPLDPEIARLASTVIERELEEPLAGPERVNAAGKRLREVGHQPQLGRGADATNLFLELPADGGLPQRHLLRVDGSAFTAGGRRFTREDLSAMFRDDPSLITPAAGLRPIVQDAILPTVASVLGPGELGYVAQLRGVYELHDVAMPLAWPRATLTVLEPAAARILAANDLTAKSFSADPDGALERLLLERHGKAASFDRATADLEDSFESLLRDVDAIDPTLQGTVRRGRRYLQATLDRLRDKSARALARRDGETRRHFERLTAHLLPLGQPAERVLSPYSHVLKFGFEPLGARLEQIEDSGEQEIYI